MLYSTGIFFVQGEKPDTESRRRGDEMKNFTADPGNGHTVEQFQGINYDFSMMFSARRLV
jgi:hypothetical protein